MDEVRWERMFPDQLEAAFERCPLVYFAYGLCEPHGPQNTLGLDALKAHALCCRAAEQRGGIVAPPDYWHVHEVGLYAQWAARHVGEARTWLTAVPPWQHFKNVCYHVRAADALGFQAAIFVTGHYGPWEDLKTLLGLLQPHFAMRLFGLGDFEANQPGFDQDGKTSGDHAGMVETSLLWALEPACVDVSRMPPAGAPGPHFAMGDTACRANRAIGQRMVDDEVRFLTGKAEQLLQAYSAAPPAQREPMTFTRLETIWRDEIEPRLAEFKSMQYDPADAPPQGSQWWLNYRAGDDYLEHKQARQGL